MAVNLCHNQTFAFLVISLLAKSSAASRPAFFRQFFINSLLNLHLTCALFLSPVQPYRDFFYFSRRQHTNPNSIVSHSIHPDKLHVLARWESFKNGSKSGKHDFLYMLDFIEFLKFQTCEIYHIPHQKPKLSYSLNFISLY